jgi:hypothetical protein
MLKKVLFLMLLCSVVLPGVAHAAVNASSQIPELNPFCWKKRDCSYSLKNDL